jgi:hypothetical protein
MKQPDKTDKGYYRLWKIWSLSDILNDTYAKFYSPSEHLVIEKVIMLFKGRVIFKQYISKKHKHFGTEIYVLCDMTIYTWDINIYLGPTTQTMMAAHRTESH